MDRIGQATEGRRTRKGFAAAVPLLLVLAALTVAPVHAEPTHDTDALLAQLQRNLDLAGALMETDDPIEAAKLATAWQAATLGVSLEPVPAPHHDAPSAAVLVLAKRHDTTPSPEQLEQVMALDALPAAQRGALTGVVDAFLALEDATRIAYADADLEGLRELAEAEPEAVAGGATSLVDAGVRVGLILGTRNDFLDATVAFQEAFGGVSSTAVASAGPGVDLCPAVALDLEGLDTTYSDNCALVLDAGGHDTYLNNAGGSKLVGGPEDCAIASEAWAAAALVDFAGDDQYVSGGRCGHNGGGRLGVGFLLDQSGNDMYTAGQLGTNGGGGGGVGFLLDQAGNDAYTAETSGTNGGGSLGVGFLLDQTGNDTYTALFGRNTGNGMNGGGSNGVGFLLDQAGNDLYHAEGSRSGINGGSNLGGLLLDATGTDGYQENSGPIIMDQTIVPKGTMGAQVDTEALTGTGGKRVLFSHEGLPVVPTQSLPEEDVEGVVTPDHEGSEEIVLHPGTDPIPVGPFDHDVGTVTVGDDGNELCVWFTPAETGVPMEVSCTNKDFLLGLDEFVERGDTPIGFHQDPEDIPGSGPIGVPATDPREVPDVPGVPAGTVQTPGYTATVEVSYWYDPNHLAVAQSVLGTDVWSPVLNPLDVEWYATHGDDVPLVVRVALYEDGEEVDGYTLVVPYLGQALAAAEKTAGTL